MRIEHIGIAVSDAEKAIETFSTLLGSGVYKSETVVGEGVRTHFLWADGVKIELLESLSDSSPVARFLSKRGEGVHHIAFSMDDASTVSKTLSEAGFELIGTGLSDGADDCRIFFIHPRSVHGLLVEGCERTFRSPARDDPEIHGLVSQRNDSDTRSELVIKISPEASRDGGSARLADELSVRLEPVFKVCVDSTSPGRDVKFMHTLLISDETDEVRLNDRADSCVEIVRCEAGKNSNETVWEIRHEATVFRLPLKAVSPLNPLCDALTPLLLSIWLPSI